MHGGMWVMNPGSIGHRAFSTSKETYGVVEITGDKIHCELRDI
jgi:predicted phosphodiesterase